MCAEIFVEKNGKLNFFQATTSINRPREPFDRPNEGSPIVVTSMIKRPSSSQFGFISRI